MLKSACSLRNVEIWKEICSYSVLFKTEKIKFQGLSKVFAYLQIFHPKFISRIHLNTIISIHYHCHNYIYYNLSKVFFFFSKIQRKYLWLHYIINIMIHLYLSKSIKWLVSDIYSRSERPQFIQAIRILIIQADLSRDVFQTISVLSLVSKVSCAEFLELFWIF